VNASTGVISGVTPGTARITASVGGVTSSVVVTVVAAPAAVAVTSSGGAGSGTVTSAPAGLTCRVLTGTAGSTCSAAFASDQAVVLTAAPDAGSAFAGWGGDCAAAGSALQCTLPASGGAPRAVTVRFNALRALAVTIAGSGAGTVTSTPAGINCSQNGAAGCTGSFADGATVTLSAAPDVNSTFGGWSGACTGTGTCTVTLSQAAAVTATFNIRPNPVPFNVTVNSSAGEYRIDLVYDLYVNGVLNSTRGRLTTVLTSAGAQPTLTLDADLGSQVTLSLRPSSSGPNGAGRVVSLGGVCAGATVSATGETNCTFTQARNASVVVNLAP
jgi:hypothetical protein